MLVFAGLLSTKVASLISVRANSMRQGAEGWTLSLQDCFQGRWGSA